MESNMAPGMGQLHCLRETSHVGMGPETPGAGQGQDKGRAGQGCQPASRTFSFVEEGAGGAVKTLKAAGVDAHRLLLLPRLAVLGTRGHGDLEGGGHETLSPLPLTPRDSPPSPASRMLRGGKPGPCLQGGEGVLGSIRTGPL